MPYELVTLACPPLTQDRFSDAAHEWLARDPSGGRLLGAWRTEIGPLFELVFLRGFDTAEALDEDRHRLLMSDRPFGLAGADVGLRMTRYAPFDFLAPVAPADYGGIYEFRTYHLKPGGLKPTIEAWRTALAPARPYTDHLVINMYALDGPPRITHIWGFSSLESRAALRSAHYGNGSWPPPGAPEQIARATSTICLPEDYSPLR